MATNPARRWMRVQNAAALSAEKGSSRQAGRVGKSIGVNVFPFGVAGKSALGLSGLVVNPEKTGKTP